MPIVRLQKYKQCYTKVSNTILNDASISLKAKGLWAFLMSKPDDWTITIAGTASQVKERYDALKPIFQELEQSGYLKRQIVSRGKGKIIKVSTLYEESSLSTVANDPDDNELSTGPFTSDVFSSDVNTGGIVTTDIPSIDMVKPDDLTHPTRTRTASRSTVGLTELSLPHSIKRKELSHYHDPEYDKVLRDNDILYLDKIFVDVIQERANNRAIELLERIIAVEGKAAFYAELKKDTSDLKSNATGLVQYLEIYIDCMKQPV